MLCKDIIYKIEETYPGYYAMDWDNVGLIAGRNNKEVKRIYIALDASDDVVDEAVRIEADLLITHHPLLFAPVKTITDENFITARLLKLIQNDISYYAMHTNYDVLRMTEVVEQKLGLTETEILEITTQESEVRGIGAIAELDESVRTAEYCERIKKVFDLPAVQLFGDPEKVLKRIAVCPGSGKSMIRYAVEKGADILITGDIGHHEGMDAVAQGLSIMDAGHYGLEQVFVEDMSGYLKKMLPEIEVEKASEAYPFIIL